VNVFRMMSGCPKHLVISCVIFINFHLCVWGGGHVFHVACVLKIHTPVCGICFVPKVGVTLMLNFTCFILLILNQFHMESAAEREDDASYLAVQDNLQGVHNEGLANVNLQLPMYIDFKC
jgi:hypothetical protein